MQIIGLEDKTVARQHYIEKMRRHPKIVLISYRNILFKSIGRVI